MFGHRSFYFTMITLCAFCVAVGIKGAREARHWAMMSEAHATGMDWSHHIENMLADLSVDEFGNKVLPDTDQVENLLLDIIAIGNIYQIDYIYPECLCDIGVGSYDPRAASRTSHDQSHEQRAHADPARRSERATHVFGNTTLHDGLAHEPTSKDLGPDPAIMKAMLEKNTHEIFIRSGDGVSAPRTYGEVYHPVYFGDDQQYLLRVFVDLDTHAATFNQFFLFAMGLTGFMGLVLVGFPTWRYGRSVKLRKIADRRAAYLADHDVLTNLHNRNSFQKNLKAVLKRGKSEKRSVLLFTFDLSGLKDVNDYNGHHVGDRLLIKFANLLIQSTPSNAHVARLGGDEFVVVIDGLPDVPLNPNTFIDLPSTVSVEIDEAMQSSIVKITGGAAQFPQDAKTVDELMQAADLAHHAAKQDSADTIYIFNKEMKSAFHARVKLRERFKAALLNGDVRPYYQPLQNLRNGKIEGFEALARWYQPDGSVLSPAHFPDLNEDYEIGALLGNVMFEQIADKMAQWRAEDVPFESVALNVVDADLGDPNFASNILKGLKERGLPPRTLAIEVTENCLFNEDTKGFIQQLSTLRAAGCKVALDDFGTGYSSISQLKNLPFSAVKIDKCFVTEVLESSDDQAIVTAMQYLGKSMNFMVVIEGIETLEQYMFFQKTGFALAQGYYVSRPMPQDAVADYLDALPDMKASKAS